MLASQRSAVALACLLSLTACGGQGTQVPVNTGDATAPVVFTLETLGRRGGDLRVTQFSGPVSGTLAADESIQIVARGDDPEGVQWVGLWGGRTIACVPPSDTASGAALVTSADPAVDGGTTSVQRVVSYAIKKADLACPVQPAPSSALEFVFYARTGNFGGLEAQSATLTLTFAP